MSFHSPPRLDPRRPTRSTARPGQRHSLTPATSASTTCASRRVHGSRARRRSRKMSESEIIPGTPVQFVHRTPVDMDGLIANVRWSSALGLPELRDFEYPREETLNIIANGPSARGAPLDGPTLAINGALKLFTDMGRAPTFWTACDPQPLVADFLRNPPEETVYLVASKC